MAYELDQATGLPLLSQQSLLSDVPNYTEAMAQVLATVFPIGIIQPYAGVFDQSTMGCWRLCDGLEVPDLAEYATLRTLLHNAHGTYDTPDLRGRSPIGVGHENVTGNTGDYDTLLKKYGDDRMPKHQHSITDPGHGHTLAFPYTGGPAFGATTLAGASGAATSSFPGQPVDAASTGITATNDAGDGTSNNVPPSLAVNFIILAAYYPPSTP